MFRIADKLENVRQRIQKATNSAGRSESSVMLLPVSKKQSAEKVLEAVDAGYLSFGENYASEAVDKQAMLCGLDAQKADKITWHFIGPVQSNKTKLIAEHFDWVQSVDREKIATRLNEQRPHDLGPLNVCIQVNIDEEQTKSGVLLDELTGLAEFVANQANLTLRGVMAIPSASSSDAELAASMSRLNQAYETLKRSYPSVDTLSMGMSSDIELAISNGSTMVRVGTAIFGERTSSV